MNKLKMFSSNYLNIFKKITVDKSDLKELDERLILAGNIVAVAHYKHNEFFYADSAKIEEVKKDKIITDDGQIFNKFGEEVNV